MFRATIRDSKLSLGPILRRQFSDWLRVNEGKRVLVQLDKPGRSNSQNAYYWVYLGVIAQETGNNEDDLHEFFKRKLLPPVFKKVLGEEIKLPRSTTKLNKSEFGEYLEKICALTNIPLPDREAAGYIPNQ